MDDQQPTSTGQQPCPPGSRFPLLPGVRSRIVQTDRLAQRSRDCQPDAARRARHQRDPSCQNRHRMPSSSCSSVALALL